MIAGECDGSAARAIAAAAAVVAGVVASAPAPPPARVQAAVLGDGFVAARAGDAGWRVVEVAADGTPRTEHVLATADTDVRIVGSAVGPIAGMLANRQVALVRASDGQTLSTWGSDARRLCDGAASSAARFGVAWLEGNDQVWVVHGATANAASDDVPPSIGGKTWCGVASAGRNLMLMWRDAKRLYFNACTPSSCRGPVAFLALDDRQELLGVGCVEKSCLIATRAPGTGAQLQLVTPAGGVKWRKPLDTAASRVSIVGAGDAAYAVGYPGAVVGVAGDGKAAAVQLWRGDGTPTLAWARGRVFVAVDAGGSALATSTVAYP
jgi:hypothetical protein